MIQIKLYTIILMINIVIVSCTTTPIHTPKNSYIHLYKSAQRNLDCNNYNAAIQDLKNLKNLYLFHPQSQKINLYLIYTYYKADDLNSSNETIQYFLKSYPNYKHLDYVLYMHGLVNMTLDKNNTILSKYVNLNWADHNPVYANIAFHSFIKLIRNYPNSIYSLDAYKRLIFLKNRIAEYELSIIKFYDTKNAYLSVIARTEKMLYYFPNTQAAYKALFYMHKAYKNIHLDDQANKIMKIITENSES